MVFCMFFIVCFPAFYIAQFVSSSLVFLLQTVQVRNTLITLFPQYSNNHNNPQLLVQESQPKNLNYLPFFCSFSLSLPYHSMFSCGTG